MSDLHLLTPGAKWIVASTASTAAAVVSTIRFSEVVTVGSILAAALVVVMGGVVTLRNNIKTFWKNLAEERGEQIKVMEERDRRQAAEQIAIQRESAERLAELQTAHIAEMAQLELAQQELRHEIRGKLGTALIELELERAKPDISELAKQLAARESWIDSAAVSLQQNTDLLAEILQVLRPVPPPNGDDGTGRLVDV